MEIDLQLFSGGGAKFNQRSGGGGRDRDAVNENGHTYKFYYIDENGNKKIKEIRAENDEKARQYWNEIKDALKVKKVVKAVRATEPLAANVTSIQKSIVDPKSGRTIDLSESQLQYTDGPKSIGSERMDTIKSLANKIRGNEKENLTIFDSSGKSIYNKEGEVDRVSAPQSVRQQGSYDIHNHARREGFLGGTFSVRDEKGQGDITNFVNNSNTQAKFISAKEGIYYIEKTGDFKATGFYEHMKSAESSIEKRRQSSIKSLEKQYNSKKISYETYLEKHRQIQNKSFVDMHNEFLKNQKKYGYNYGLIKS